MAEAWVFMAADYRRTIFSDDSAATFMFEQQQV